MKTKSSSAPSPETINSLAFSYQTLQQQIEALRAQQEPIRDQLIGLALAHGAFPPKSDRVKRLETREYKVSVSQGMSVGVDKDAVEELRGELIIAGAGRLFKKLFRSDIRYAPLVTSQELADGVVKIPAEAPRRLVEMFRRTVTVKKLSPTLKIESLGEEKGAVA